MNAMPSILYRTAFSTESVAFCTDDGSRPGGTTPEAARLRDDLARFDFAQRLVAHGFREDTEEWYGFDTRERAIEAEPEAGELRRYRVRIENPIRPFDETPRLAPEEVTRLIEACMARVAPLLPPDTTADHDDLRVTLRRREGVGVPVSHAELWLVAAQAAGLKEAYPEPTTEPESLEDLLQPTEEDRMGLALEAMGFDAAHLCPGCGEWWLFGTPPVARPTLLDQTLVPPPTKE